MANKLLERVKNTKARTLLVFGVFIFIIITLIVFFATRKSTPLGTEQSKTTKVPQITAIPGGVTSERYQELQEEENRKRAEEAKKKGGSEVATIIGSRSKDALASKERFGIEDLIKAECKCPPCESKGLDSTKIASLLDDTEKNPELAMALLMSNPGLAKAMCKEKPELALSLMEKDIEAAKLILNECPELAQALAERNPALFKKLMLENPELARKLALANPELFKKLLLEDPEFAKAMARLNPDLVKTLMQNDPDFASKFSKKYPDIVKALTPPEPAKAVLSPQALRDLQQKQLQLSDQQQKQIQTIMNAMEGQAKSAFQAWNEFNPQQFVQGEWARKEAKDKDGGGNKDGIGFTARSGDKTGSDSGGSILFKAGTIVFAVLDTTISSDEPGPILATVVEGKYKGARLIGSFTPTPQPGGLPPEKLTLNFSTLNIATAAKSIAIQAVAIDPDTARTALASDVDHHFLLRYGSILASSFLVGYAKAITSAGSVQTSSANGLATTTTAAQLNGRKEILAALGEVGKKLGEAWKLYGTIPPTVTVEAGTGVGILFLSDVTG